eukprot:Gregarina_sp_Poly_1__4631@NODE_2478_length_2073_cov_640_902293_g1571_i0_p2_GENE_NODE_2478_length_2073_cov_640_902293_g1571_i0NODE_2478_length_2073_cov_640_902293_g1571_i0_p2_ORF_typecomplete_len256_score35_35_NODE_2478_length_2073_cov_640_902293_g1571_i012121979
MGRICAYLTAVIACVAQEEQIVRPTTTTTTTTVPPPVVDEFTFPDDARWRIISSSNCAETCNELYSTKEAAQSCFDGLACEDAEMQYLRTMEFNFCSANKAYVIPIDGNKGRDESFWDGTYDAFMWLPVVNTDGSWKESSAKLIIGTESSGGTSCYASTNDMNKAGIDTPVTASQNELEFHLFEYLLQEYLGVDHGTLLVTTTRDVINPVMIGDHKGVIALAQPEPFPPKSEGVLRGLASVSLGLALPLLLLADY